jgi:hypothetical protein
LWPYRKSRPGSVRVRQGCEYFGDFGKLKLPAITSVFERQLFHGLQDEPGRGCMCRKYRTGDDPDIHHR